MRQRASVEELFTQEERWRMEAPCLWAHPIVRAYDTTTYYKARSILDYGLPIIHDYSRSFIINTLA